MAVANCNLCKCFGSELEQALVWGGRYEKIFRVRHII